jgi:hypothetical protein
VSVGPDATRADDASGRPSSEEGSAISEIPLDGLEGWSDEHLGRLRDVGITSAEQVVALAATPRGLTSLAEQLRADEDRARELLELARGALAPPARNALERPVDIRDYGLGVRPPARSEHEPPEDRP